MRKHAVVRRCFALVLAGVMAVTVMPDTVRKVRAVNPIVQDLYTADPAPMTCSDGRLYVYTSHDEDETKNDFYTMNDWKCYSTTDMVNWTDHGTVLSFREFEWAKDNSSWACQCVERDGKYYMYVPINHKNGTTAIGVAVAESPVGPFHDPLGQPLIGPAQNYIDPTVWIDEDGQAYLYWGNPDLYCVKLNEDMISYDKNPEEEGFVDGIKRWKLTTGDFPELSSVTNANDFIKNGTYAENAGESLKKAQSEFGIGVRVENNKVRRPTLYEEGPWFYGRGGHYYLVYAANGIPERIDYSMSDNPLGPWEYKGMILDERFENTGNGTGSFTNHPGVVDYKGHSYIFYHTGQLDKGSGYHRSVAVEEITYNEDGTIDTVPITAAGVEPVDVLDPYKRVEAETIEYSNSLKAESDARMGKYGVEKKPVADVPYEVCLTDIQNKDYISIRNVDFGQYGAIRFTACTQADAAKDDVAGKISIYLDEINGEPAAEYEVKGGNSPDEWVTGTIEVDETVFNGIHDMFMVFEGEEPDENDSEEDVTGGDDTVSGLFNFDYWSFVQDVVPLPEPSATPSAGQDSALPTATALPTVVPVPEQPQSTAEPDKVSAPGRIKGISAKGGKKMITLKWNKVSGASGYQVQYSTDKKLKKAVKSILTRKTTVQIKKLKSRKVYYVRVKAYATDASGRKLYGKSGNVVKVKVR